MKKFEVGQKYTFVDWFSGGRSFYTVKERTESTISLDRVAYEADGIHESVEDFDISTDEEGNESIFIYEYHGHEARIYAE